MDNEVKCWCKHCGVELPPSHTGPCPKCGKSGKRCEASAMLTIGLVLSHSAQKIHKYIINHPIFIVISIVLTIISLSVGYLLDDALVGLLIGIILAILNLWLTPRVKETIVEITHLGDTGKVAQEAKTKSYSPEDIYNKLESIEHKIDSSSRTQIRVGLNTLGAALIFLGLSYYLAFLQRVNLDTTTFYSINISGLLALGVFTLVFANTFKPRHVGKDQETKERLKEAEMGTKGRKNIKKPSKAKLEKMKAKKK